MSDIPEQEDSYLDLAHHLSDMAFAGNYQRFKIYYDAAYPEATPYAANLIAAAVQGFKSRSDAHAAKKAKEGVPKNNPYPYVEQKLEPMLRAILKHKPDLSSEPREQKALLKDTLKDLSEFKDQMAFILLSDALSGKPLPPRRQSR
jgi:hypothetical protein